MYEQSGRNETQDRIPPSLALYDMCDANMTIGQYMHGTDVVAR